MRRQNWEDAVNYPGFEDTRLLRDALDVPGFDPIVVWYGHQTPQVGYVPEQELRATGPVETPKTWAYNRELVRVGGAAGGALGFFGHVVAAPLLPDGGGLGGFLLELLAFILVGVIIGAYVAVAVVKRSHRPWAAYSDKLDSLAHVMLLDTEPAVVQVHEALMQYRMARVAVGQFPELAHEMPDVPRLAHELFQTVIDARRARPLAVAERAEVDAVIGDFPLDEDDAAMAQVRARGRAVDVEIQRLDTLEVAALDRVADAARAAARVDAQARARIYLANYPVAAREETA
ncbi:hypothetical protein [Janibacter sp. LM]|uniref:hypothetical protein n=1 Tax=Janibacter sp. LM TaxID=3144845 RepID=UPI0031F68E24